MPQDHKSNNLLDFISDNVYWIFIVGFIIYIFFIRGSSSPSRYGSTTGDIDYYDYYEP